MEADRVLTRDRVNKLMGKGTIRAELKSYAFSRDFKARSSDTIETVQDIKGNACDRRIG